MVSEDQPAGTAILRRQFYDSVIKQIAMRKYKFKQAVSIVTTNAWKNYFYREKQGTLSGATGNTVRGIPRGAAFPQAIVEWDRVQTTIEKYGLEDNIAWEDIISSDLDVQNRTLIKIGEGIVKSVDDQIYSGLTESTTASVSKVINQFWVTPWYNDSEASASNAVIVDNLMRCKQLIEENDYDTENLMLFMNPRTHRCLVKYLTDKGAQFPKISETQMTNGKVGNLLGFDIVVSRSVTTSEALVVIPKRCGTWKELVALQTNVTEDPYKSVRIRAVESGVLQLTDPKAVVLMNNIATNG